MAPYKNDHNPTGRNQHSCRESWCQFLMDPLTNLVYQRQIMKGGRKSWCVLLAMGMNEQRVRRMGGMIAGELEMTRRLEPGMFFYFFIYSFFFHIFYTLLNHYLP